VVADAVGRVDAIEQALFSLRSQLDSALVTLAQARSGIRATMAAVAPQAAAESAPSSSWEAPAASAVSWGAEAAATPEPEAEPEPEAAAPEPEPEAEEEPAPSSTISDWTLPEHQRPGRQEEAEPASANTWDPPAEDKSAANTEDDTLRALREALSALNAELPQDGGNRRPEGS
jgi:hypothetical protein